MLPPTVVVGTAVTIFNALPAAPAAQNYCQVNMIFWRNTTVAENVDGSMSITAPLTAPTISLILTRMSPSLRIWPFKLWLQQPYHQHITLTPPPLRPHQPHLLFQ